MKENQRPNLISLRPRTDISYVSQGRTVLAADRDGFIRPGPDRGLFVHETRLLSRYRYLIDDRPPTPVALSNVEQHTWLGYYIALPPGVETSQPATGEGLVDYASEQTLELRLTRYVGQGIHEDVDLTNYSQQPTFFELALEVDADFVDQIEARSRRRQNGELHRDWREIEGGIRDLVFDYRAEHEYQHQGHAGTASIHRSIKLRFEQWDSPPRYENGAVRFKIDLAPGGSWHCCIKMTPEIDGVSLPPLGTCRSLRGVHSEADRRREIFLNEATQFKTAESETLSPVILGALEQAKQDLAALRLYDLDCNERAWTMAAGLPMYLALFGRDTLTAAWQASLASPDMLRGTAVELPRWQGKKIDDWRDEQPGKMLHEAHTGPLAALNFNPRGRYYGSITTSGFYPVVVSELWHWTGDRALVGSLIEPMLKALRWLDSYSDLNDNGFYDYLTRSDRGGKHQAWKDSRDAIVYPDGSQAEPPIATCEEQGFVYLAKLHSAEVLWWFGRRDEARELYKEASEFKKRFNEVFWMPEEGFFAMALDARGEQIKAIGSNPGHCLATGIVDRSLVEATADRLFVGDLFSGWGIRTLSSNNPAFNPYSYHRGSVWPVEQATFALGLVRYGLHPRVAQLTQAQFEAAGLFDFFRLPEVFSGHHRDLDHPFPALYPQTNSPQAWSASAVFTMVQSLLGLYPYAPLNLLLVDPHLPDWLPQLTLENLRVGESRTTIRFYRRADGSSDYQVLERHGSLHILRQPSPWSLTADFTERTIDALKSLLPRR